MGNPLVTLIYVLFFWSVETMLITSSYGTEMYFCKTCLHIYVTHYFLNLIHKHKEFRTLEIVKHRGRHLTRKYAGCSCMCEYKMDNGERGPWRSHRGSSGLMGKDHSPGKEKIYKGLDAQESCSTAVKAGDWEGRKS